MLIIKARINLFSGKNKRKTPFKNGYRPLFDMPDGTKISGMINLLDRNEFKPGDEGVVEIKFNNAHFIIGSEIMFCECLEPLGKCVVLDIIEQ